MNPSLAIIPKPQKAELRNGGLELTPHASISYPAGGEQAALLLQQLTGYSLESAEGDIRFELNARVKGDEAYRIDVDDSGIQIAASTPAGLYYGAQTLRQLLPAELERRTTATALQLPYLRIEDAPRFPHRGFMLDVARHFFSVGEVKRIIDLLAMQKINRFHLHLTDDQGWRIEIKKYPRLTEVGSKRRESQVGGWILSRAVYDGAPHSGFYTQEEIREIVAYARENYIELIPEIDLPGHAAAAISAYPELSCSGEPAEVRTSIGISPRPLCVGKESTFEFLDDIFTEIAELFPYRHIHIGGDEVKKRAWNACPHCQARMSDQGLKNGRELQAYFENRLVSLLKAKGCRSAVWSDALHESLDRDVVNQYWFFTGKKRTIAELKSGRKTIVSDFSALYLDYSYGVMELAKTYAFEPQFSAVADEQADSLLGVEGALWTEYVDSRNRIEWQMFPRLLAISEMAWSSRDGRDYQDFLARLACFEKRLDVLGVNYTPPECYLRRQRVPGIPHVLRLLFSRQHPAVKEYKKYAGQRGEKE